MLQVNGSARAPDTLQMQRLDLGDLRLAAPGRVGPGDGDLDVVDVGRQPCWPGIVIMRQIGRRNAISRGAQPSRPG